MRPGWTPLVALVLACGPSTPHGDGGADGSGGSESTTSTGATISTTTSGASAETSSTGDDDSTKFDLGTAFDVGVTPDVYRARDCDLPDTANADVSGTTPDGDRTLIAAAFSEFGGGECGSGLAVALAADPETLAAQVGIAPYAHVTDGLEIFVGMLRPFEPGEYPATMYLEPEGSMTDAIANVMIVPDERSRMPVFQLTITPTDPAWTLGGTITASYCEQLFYGPCP